ncbi:MAG: Lin0512 family protein [Candidatus Tectomicrobia bacterium]|nr:Lin0512 family protein [Candidatus Tectomicrobia bacterium]
MAMKRCLLEIGTGVDLHGRDYTTAAQRAVRDAIQRNSLSFIRAFGATPHSMLIDVTIAVTRPEMVNHEEVLKMLPYGEKTITVVQGGLEIPSEDGSDATVIANAAVIVSLDI